MDQTDSAVAAIKGRRGPVRGPCKVCKHLYRSYNNKVYCSLECLKLDPDYRNKLNAMLAEKNLQRIREIAARECIEINDEGKMTITCLNCGKPKLIPLGRRNEGWKFCGKWCRREYYTARFDRFVANPESIALPQNYDEFLVKEDLPCLVQGCNWVGKHLSQHCNFVHGITAEQLKEMAGFNSTTGLVTKEISTAISARMTGHKASKEVLEGFKLGWSTHRKKEHTLRLEGMEHLKKSRLLIDQKNTGVFLPCQACGKEVEQPATSLKKFCNHACRREFWSRPEQNKVLKCDHCGQDFHSSHSQFYRHKSGKEVFCSRRCRALKFAPTMVAAKARKRKENAGG